MGIDTVIDGGAVFTGATYRKGRNSIALRDGKIVGVDVVGNFDTQAGPHTQRIDVGDAFLCPGLHDSHMHFFHSALYSSPLALNYRGTSEADCVERMVAFAQTRPAGTWLLCQGWREYRWDPPALPSKHSLDAAFPTTPVAMYSGDAHSLWLNSCAMAELGLSRDSIAPAGGSYDRDESGELSGIVREAAAMELMPRIVASFSREELLDAYRRQLRELASYGITSLCDMSLMAAPGLDFVRDDLYADLLAAGDLTCRVNLFPTLLDDMSRFEVLNETLRDPLLMVAGFKQFFDGVSSQHTAWLHDPYEHATGADDCGRPTIDPAVMRRLVLAAAAKGYPVRIHTIGDEAIHCALDIFEEARERFGALPAGKHHCLEHLEGFLPRDIARVAQLDVVAAVQPCHMTLDPGGPEKDLGAQRVPYMWPFKSLLDTGAILAFGTDSPVVDVDPRAGLYTAITRQDAASGKPDGGWLPQQRIGAAAALRAYTAGSAAAAGRYAEVGTLEPGKWADIAAFDTDLCTCRPEEILEAGTIATFVAGKQVFSQ